MKQAVKQDQKASQQLRIIGGQWRGRKLPILSADGLRPTGDRIRETLFNWLAPEIAAARCLDLFAGTGALGFESLSRGAAHCLMLEANAQVAKQLKNNAVVLGAEGVQVLTADTLRTLQAGNSGVPYQIVFVDPPFASCLWQPVIDALSSGQWLSKEASVYIESGVDDHYQVPANWHLHRDKRAGKINYRLYYLQENIA